MSGSDLRFTGERLHAGESLFGIDLMRHRAAYRFAIDLAGERGAERVLELGSGTGYGTAELAAELPSVIAVDRVAPLDAGRTSGARFLRADLTAMPLRGRPFDLALSFQVIEHLNDPMPYLGAMSAHLDPDGSALVTTPNRLVSDGENPFHVHEYEADELTLLLSRFFEEVEMLGVSATGEAARYHEARLTRIQRIVRLDPLGLRHRMPRSLVEGLFSRLALWVRRDIAGDEGLPEVTLADFPIGPVAPDSLDLLACCRGPRSS